MADKSKLLIIAQDNDLSHSHLSSCRAARQLSWMAQHLPNQLVCAFAGKRLLHESLGIEAMKT